ncbi:MAG: hypothetical protein ACI37T_01985 [Candidatus Gastranaerophilaceae bacterium]
MKTNLNIDLISKISIDRNENISLDFSNIENIALQDIRKISDIQKVAILNGKKLYIKNAIPEILQILEVTGLHKSFSNFDDKSITPDKRLRRL